MVCHPGRKSWILPLPKWLCAYKVTVALNMFCGSSSGWGRLGCRCWSWDLWELLDQHKLAAALTPSSIAMTRVKSRSRWSWSNTEAQLASCRLAIFKALQLRVSLFPKEAGAIEGRVHLIVRDIP